MFHDIQEILTIIETNDIELVSFDIFDTLVMRKTARPVDVFEAVGKQLAIEDKISLSAYEFAHYRYQAEKNARKKSLAQEICFEQIYANLEFDDLLLKTIQDLEITKEKDLSFINHQILMLIETLMKKNIRVVFVSDIYFSQSDIRNIFFYKHSFLNNIPLYSSCDFGVTKQSGDLFKMVSEKESVDFCNWLHIGDNFESDVKSARLYGIHAIAYGNTEYFQKITAIERIKYNFKPSYQAIRSLCSYPPKTNLAEHDFYTFGAIVWGPVLLSFSDWVINKLLKNNISTLVCIMREGELFSKVIKQRIKQRNINNLDSKVLFASRQSTFLASLDIKDALWIDKLIHSSYERRGYLLDNLLNDLEIIPDPVLSSYVNNKMSELSNLYHSGDTVLNYLKSVLNKNQNTLEIKITNEKKILSRFFRQSIDENIANCALLDLGGGGTILYQLEKALEQKSRLNLLFYATPRIYRYINTTLFVSFLGTVKNNDEILVKLNRSFEVIEPLLTGTQGSTLKYLEEGQQIKPFLGAPVTGNALSVESFCSGVSFFIEQFDKYDYQTIAANDAYKILLRFINIPTETESNLYRNLYHQDNFGVEAIFPVLSQQEIDYVNQNTVQTVWDKITHSPNAFKNIITWPEAVISYIDENFLLLSSGVNLDKNSDESELLMLQIIDSGWTHFTVYGAGKIFESLLVKIKQQGMAIEAVVDRKAEISSHTVCGYQVITLEQAIKQGRRKFVVASFAYKEDIVPAIYHQAEMCHCAENIEIISL